MTPLQYSETINLLPSTVRAELLAASKLNDRKAAIAKINEIRKRAAKEYPQYFKGDK